jgi:hypothetical protein
MPKKSKPGHVGFRTLALVVHEILDIPVNHDLNEPTLGLKVVHGIIDTITAALQRGESVHIQGFGKFTPKKPRAYHKLPALALHGRPNLPEGATYSPEMITVPGRTKAHFKPTLTLMAILNHDAPNWKEAQLIASWNKDDN